jgi:pyruvate/2-oxoacid:ferredoxin oxidoreductase alpha subunit
MAPTTSWVSAIAAVIIALATGLEVMTASAIGGPQSPG